MRYKIIKPLIGEIIFSYSVVKVEAGNPSLLNKLATLVSFHAYLAYFGFWILEEYI